MVIDCRTEASLVAGYQMGLAYFQVEASRPLTATAQAYAIYSHPGAYYTPERATALTTSVRARHPLASEAQLQSLSMLG